MTRKKVVRRRALRIEQNPERPLYVFTLTGEELLQMADISRVERSDAGQLLGYQRGAARQHIRNITEYLDGPDVLLPNSLVLALASRVRFRASRGAKSGDRYASAGTIEIPVPRDGDAKPAWIVDGQQRTLALTRSRRKGFPVVINAFVADQVSLRREQFLRVNSTKPLPRGLITELLPVVDGVLPEHLATRRVPSAVCDLLNRDPESPFLGLIRRTSTNGRAGGRAVVADTAIVQMIHESLTSPTGCLFTYRNVATGGVDLAGIRQVLLVYWSAVSAEFPEAWGLSPSRSRLMHGAGIRAMGRVMDQVMKTVDPRHPATQSRVRKEVARLRPVCRWIGGEWDILKGMRWNEIQNVRSHIHALGDALLRAYLEAWSGE